MMCSDLEKHSPFEGSFNFENLICNLFRHDVNPLHPTRCSRPDSIDRYNGFVSAFYAGHAQDYVPVGRLPRDLANEVYANLFHERVHYWQLISCPLQQLRFVNFLDKLRFEVARMGGNPSLICGQTMGIDTVPVEKLEEFIAGADANFLPEKFTPQMVRMTNLISEEPFTDMPFLELPHNFRHYVLPAYGATLGFGPSHAVVMVPFTGCPLLESAAYISQLLFEGKPLPYPKHIDNKEHWIYLGPWEFWRRLHGPRYDTDENLALGFLAAVDLAMVSDVIEPEPMDSEYRCEMYSIPYRFGKLAYRAQGLPPLACHDEDPSQAVAQFQEGFCSWTGWPNPKVALKKMVVFLTRLLVFACARAIPDSEDNRRMVIQAVDRPTKDLAGRIEDLVPIWQLIRDTQGTIGPPIGQKVLGTMLNACMYRIEHPGVFALPHRYVHDIVSRFPLPIVLFEGEYYIDDIDAVLSSSCDSPYTVDVTDLLHDCIGLMTVKSLRRESKKCGFVEDRLDCWYTKGGLGCPQKPLAPKQDEMRKKTSLDDWCHWMLRALILRIAPAEALKRWQAKISHDSQ